MNTWKIVPAEDDEPAALTDVDLVAIQVALLGANIDVTGLFDKDTYRAIMDKIRPVGHVAAHRVIDACGGDFLGCG